MQSSELIEGPARAKFHFLSDCCEFTMEIYQALTVLVENLTIQQQQAGLHLMALAYLVLG